MFRTLIVAFFVLECVFAATIENNDKNSKLSVSSVFVDDVVVESTLNVRRKSGTRQGRTGPGILIDTNNKPITPQKIDGSTLLTLQRPKRQYGRRRGGQQQPQFGSFPQQQFGNYPQQQFGNYPQFQPITGSASNANAQAQAFNANSPLGNFGASAANSGSQGFSFDPSGIRGSAGLSGSQSYNLPNGNTLAISYANGFSIGPDGKPTITKGNSIAYTGSDGKAIPGFG